MSERKLNFVRGLQITEHAVERYIERVRPGLDSKRARKELEYLVHKEGIVLPDTPEWLKDVPVNYKREKEADAYVELGTTGIICVVYHKMVLTVITRGGLSSEARLARNERQRKRRRARRESRSNKAWLGESGQRWR